MKTKQIYFTFILIMSSIWPMFGQWTASTFTANDQNDQFIAASFPTENVAYVSGNMGGLYKSIDGGVNWTSIQNFGPFMPLTDVHFVNADTGLLSSNGFFSQRTFDGGNTWEPMTSSSHWYLTTAFLKPIKVVGHVLYGSYTNVDTAFVLKSNDYGTSWTVLFTHLETNARPFEFSFLDELNAYFVNPNELTEIYKTNDGCLSFDTITVVNSTLNIQKKMHFKDANNGYFYGDWNAFFPGRIWINAQNDAGVQLIDLDGFGILPVLDMDFNTGKIYASSFYGKIFWAQNNGIYWNEQVTPVNDPILTIEFVDENKGIAVSGNTILYTTNGGSSLGVNEIVDLSESIRIYPNPTSNKFQINVDKAIELEQINLIDIHGKRIETLKNSTLEVDVSTFSQGTYFVEMITKQGRHIQKLIVE